MSENLFAFESWSGGSSALYEGAEALEFVKKHHASGTFARLHVGGAEIQEEYKILQVHERDYHTSCGIDEGRQW